MAPEDYGWQLTDDEYRDWLRAGGASEDDVRAAVEKLEGRR